MQPESLFLLKEPPSISPLASDVSNSRHTDRPVELCPSAPGEIRQGELMEKKPENGRQTEIEQMFEAVKRGATIEMKEQLDTGVSPDCRDKMERTPLIAAAEAGNVDVVQTLLDHGADVNAVDADGETAVMKATYGGYLDVIKLLVSHGADVDLRNHEGMTALEIAQEMEANDVITYLAPKQTASSARTESSGDPDDNGPATHGPTRASAAMAPSSEPESYVQELDLEMIPEPGRSAYFEPHKEPETARRVRGQEAEVAPPDDDSESTADLSGDGEVEEGGSKAQRRHDDILGSQTKKAPVVPASILANKERIEFDALDNKQVRNINEKIKKVLDKAGFEVGDYVIDTVFKGSPMAVLKPRSQENKRWRKLKKHPDWIIDPRRLTELIGGCAARRLCLAEGVDVSSLSLSHFIELYYAKNLKLILALAEEASTNKYTVRQLKKAVDDHREHKDDHDPGKEIIRTLDQPVPLLDDPDLMELCKDKDRVLEELSKAERRKIRSLIKARKPGLDEWKGLMDTLEGILSALEAE